MSERITIDSGRASSVSYLRVESVREHGHVLLALWEPNRRCGLAEIDRTGARRLADWLQGWLGEDDDE